MFSVSNQLAEALNLIKIEEKYITGSIIGFFSMCTLFFHGNKKAWFYWEVIANEIFNIHDSTVGTGLATLLLKY